MFHFSLLVIVVDSWRANPVALINVLPIG